MLSTHHSGRLALTATSVAWVTAAILAPVPPAVAATTPVWSAPVSIDPGSVAVVSVSCPTTTFCIAGDGGGNAITYS